jgi:hypothetical protein
MSFLFSDPCCEALFGGIACPADVAIPLDDLAAWQLYPAHRGAYNKLLICETQNLAHAPHGVIPDRFPVFSKPIYNLLGLGAGSRVIHSLEQYFDAVRPGHMWTELLTGLHVSTDIALECGVPRWWRHATGTPGARGTFDHWTVHARREPALEQRLEVWVTQQLRGFTGVINVETIGGTIIECHLRMADQWANLNGPGWLDAVVGLYAGGGWNFRDERRDGYSVVLFMPHGVEWRLDRAAASRLAKTPGIASIQVVIDNETPADQYSNPPGGFRVAVVNCWDLSVGRAVRAGLERLVTAAQVSREPALALY